MVVFNILFVESGLLVQLFFNVMVVWSLVDKKNESELSDKYFVKVLQ